MKLRQLKEAHYGTGLSARERDDLFHKVKNSIRKIDDVYHDDEQQRVVLTTTTNDYYQVIENLTELFGEPIQVNGYEQGRFKKNIPRWIIKDHQITVTIGLYVDIEISKV